MLALRSAPMKRIINSVCTKTAFFKNVQAVRPMCIEMQKASDLYSILGVRPSATQGEIKQAYYDLTMLYHPDRNDGSHEAAMKFREITEAYEILGNTMLRQRYDMDLPMLPRRRDIEEVDVKYKRFFESRDAVLSGKKPVDTYEDFFDWHRHKQERQHPAAFVTTEMIDDDKIKAEKRIVPILFVIIMVYVIYRDKIKTDNTYQLKYRTGF